MEDIKQLFIMDLDLVRIYDLENDPGEFNDLWDKGIDDKLKLKLMHSHIDAVMNTSSAGGYNERKILRKDIIVKRSRILFHLSLVFL